MGSTIGVTAGPAAHGADGRYWDAAVETIPQEQLQELQLRRLRVQLRRLHDCSEFYRERFRAAGLVPEEIRKLGDLASVPSVSKDDLRAEQAKHPPFGRFVASPKEAWAELHPSTGTTGRPVATIWSRRDVAAIADFTARTLWQFGVRPEDTIQNAFAYGLWVAGISAHYGAAAIGALCIPTGASVSTQRQIDFLTLAKSTVLLATPSYGMHIGEVLREQGIDPESLALRLGCFGGEAGAEAGATRRKLEQGLGIEAFDYYGLAEVGPTFASECEAKAGLHFAEDHVLVEVADPETRRPVPDGQVGVLVFTHLTREATPMVRYWSNDYARLDRSPCVCGRTHVRAVGGILGRHDDLIIYKGAKFYPVQVEETVRRFTELSDEFRIEVELAGATSSQITCCTVVAEWSGRPLEGVEARLQKALRESLGVTPLVRIQDFGSLERTTFKAKRIVRTVAGG